MSNRRLAKDLAFAIRFLLKAQEVNPSQEEAIEAVQRMIDTGIIDLFYQTVMTANALVSMKKCTARGQPKSGIIIANEMPPMQR